MKALDWLIDRTRLISRYSLWGVGSFMLFTVFLVGGEVIFRKFGSGLIRGASEVGGYMLAISSAWAYSFTLLNRSNIRFDAFYIQSGPKLRAYLDLFSLLCLGVFILTVTYYAMGVLQTSIRLGSHSSSSLSVPLWVPQLAWLGGFVFLSWTIFILTLRTLAALIQGDHETVLRLAGLGSAQSEAKEKVDEIGDKASEVNEGTEAQH